VAAPFATADDVAARWRPLNTQEQAQADALCADASVLLRARFPGIDSQISGGQLDEAAVVMVAAGMVRRAMIGGGEGIQQQSETVGPYSTSQTYANPLGNVFLTAADLTVILGYIPAGGTHQYGNTTARLSPSVDDFESWYDGGVTVIPSNPGV
jgi:hypothetical protein